MFTKWHRKSAGSRRHPAHILFLCLVSLPFRCWNMKCFFIKAHTGPARFLWRLCQLLCLVRGQWSLYYLCTGVSLIMWLRACRAKASVKVSVQCERSTRDWINMSYVAIRSALGLVCVKRVLYSWVSVSSLYFREHVKWEALSSWHQIESSPLEHQWTEQRPSGHSGGAQEKWS